MDDRRTKHIEIYYVYQSISPFKMGGPRLFAIYTFFLRIPLFPLPSLNDAVV